MTVFVVMGAIAAACLLVIIAGMAQRFPVFTACLLTAATILAGFSIRPSGIYDPPPPPAAQTTEVVFTP